MGGKAGGGRLLEIGESTLGSPVRPNISPRSMAQALYAGQAPGISKEGDYRFSSDEAIVWETELGSSPRVDKRTPVGKWLSGLVEICNVEIAPDVLADVSYELGLLARRGK